MMMDRNGDRILEDAMADERRLECIDPEVGELLPFHASGTLSPADAPVFAAHLDACARCAEDVRVMRDVARGIASLRARPEPGTALAAPSPVTRRRPLLLLFAGIAAAALLAIVLATQPRPTDRQADAQIEALASRVAHLETQNALLGHAVAREHARAESSPLAGIPIASPPNL